MNNEANYIVVSVWNGSGYSEPVINSFSSLDAAKEAFNTEKAEMLDGGYIEDNEDVEQPKHTLSYQYFKSEEDNGLVMLLHYPAAHAAILQIDPMVLDVQLITVVKDNARAKFVDLVIGEQWEDTDVLDEFDAEEDNVFGEHLEDGYAYYELILDRFVDMEVHDVHNIPNVGMVVTIVYGQGCHQVITYTSNNDERAWEIALKTLSTENELSSEAVTELQSNGYYYDDSDGMEYRITYPDLVKNLL